jgi:hypothetical protein
MSQIPQQTSFQPKPQVATALSGTSQIGDFQLIPYPGPSANIGNELWVTCGNTSAVRAVDAPIAAQMDSLKIFGDPGLLPATTAITQVAVSPTGIMVAAIASGTNVWVSYNGGRSWSVVAHNAGGTVRCVTWDPVNNVFITGGNTAVLQLVSTSPDGITFTAKTGATLVGCTADSGAQVTTSAGVTVFAAAGGTVAVGSSTNSTAWTARTLNQAVVTLACIAHNGNGVYLVTGTGSTAANTSPDGTTWAAATMPASSPNIHALAGGVLSGNSVGTFGFIDGTTTLLYTSTTGATSSWSVASLGWYQQTATQTTPTIIKFCSGYFNISSVPGNTVLTNDAQRFIHRTINPASMAAGVGLFSNGQYAVAIKLVGNSLCSYSTVGLEATYVGYSTLIAGALAGMGYAVRVK